MARRYPITAPGSAGPCPASEAADAARGPPHAQQRAYRRGFDRLACGLRGNACTRQAGPHAARARTGHATAPPLQQILRPALRGGAGILVQQAARHTSHAGVLQALGQGLQQHRTTCAGARLVGKKCRFHGGYGLGVVRQRTLGAGRIQRDGTRFNQIRKCFGQLCPRRTHRLQQTAQRMARTMRGPAAQLLAPPRQLGVGRQRVAAGVEHVVEFLQQRKPRHCDIALRFGHERGGHRPFRPTAAPLVEETVQRGTAHYVIPYGWAGAAGRVGQRLASCRSSAFSTSTSACQASGSSLCRR